MKIELTPDKEPETNWDILYGHLESRVLFSEDLIPAFLCSVGAHIGNLRQRKEPFFFVNRQPDDLRLNVTVVAPSGFSKSHTMRCLIGKYGIIPVNDLKATFRGKLTEAGFIGTINQDGEPTFGDAYDYGEGFLAFNEITNIFLASGHEHSAEMVNQVMEALSEGRVSKRLARGLIEYPTVVTIWGGVQPRRFDFSQGLARRFLFVSRNWQTADVDVLKELRFRNEHEEAKDIFDEINKCRDIISDVKNGFNISELTFSKKMQEQIKERASTHLDTGLFQRAMIGRAIVDRYRDSVVEIKATKENKELLKRFKAMIDRVAEGSDLSTLKTELLSMGGAATRRELFEKFQRYSYNIDTFTDLLERALKNKMVKMENVVLERNGKKTRPKRAVVLTTLGGATKSNRNKITKD